MTEQSSKEREAVEAALLKEGDDSSNPSAKELLEKGEGGALAAETGTGLGGVAAVPPKHIVPRPAPQKNFNLKVGASIYPVCVYTNKLCDYLRCHLSLHE